MQAWRHASSLGAADYASPVPSTGIRMSYRLISMQTCFESLRDERAQVITASPSRYGFSSLTALSKRAAASLLPSCFSRVLQSGIDARVVFRGNGRPIVGFAEDAATIVVRAEA